jgi:hypothetical protein
MVGQCTILRDAEYDAGARITLERGCAYPVRRYLRHLRLFFHARLLGSEVEAEFPAMREGCILDNHPSGLRGYRGRPTPVPLAEADSIGRLMDSSMPLQAPSNPSPAQM